MKFLRPLARRNNTSSSQKPATFGQARAAQLEQRLQSARNERLKVTRAQYAAESPLDKTLQEKGSALDMKINRLKSEK